MELECEYLGFCDNDLCTILREIKTMEKHELITKKNRLDAMVFMIKATLKGLENDVT